MYHVEIHQSSGRIITRYISRLAQSRHERRGPAIASALAASLPGTDWRFSPGSSKSCVALGIDLIAQPHAKKVA
jgi:hypothetical protein